MTRVLLLLVLVSGCGDTSAEASHPADASDSCPSGIVVWDRLTGDSAIFSLASHPTTQEIALAVRRDKPGSESLLRMAPTGEEISRRDMPWVRHVAFGKNGDLFASGSFSGSLDLGVVMLTAEPWGNSLVAQLDANDGVVWAKAVAGTHVLPMEYWTNLLTTNDGGLVLLAPMHYEPDPPMSRASVLVRLDGAGNELWRKSFGDADNDISIHSQAVDSDGNVVLSGTIFNGSVDLGGDLISGADLDHRSFVLKLGADGSYQWHRRLSAWGVRMDLEGNIYLVSATDVEGAAQSRLSVTSLDESGTTRWTITRDMSGNSQLILLALNAFGGVFAMNLALGDVVEWQTQIFAVSVSGHASETCQLSPNQFVQVVEGASDGALLLAGDRDPPTEPMTFAHDAFVTRWRPK